MADTKAPPAPPDSSVYLIAPAAPAPSPAVTADWTKPGVEQPEPTGRKGARRRGIPAAPALAAAGNAATLAVTSAYAAGGWPALAAAGGALAAGGAASVAKRRSTVKRRSATVKASRSGGAGSWPSVSSGSRRGGSGGGSGGGNRSASTPAASRTAAAGGASRQASAGGRTAPGRPGGASSPSALNRLADRLRGGDGKTKQADTAKAKKHAKKATSAQANRLARTAAAATRRGAATAWSASKPARQRTRRATADALRAVRSGIWGTICHLSLRKGAARALASWKARHAKHTAPATAPPAVAATVRRPAATSTASTFGAARMSGHHFVGPATEAARAAANYNPTGMVQVIADFAGLAQALELYAEAMKITVENADAKFPLDPRLIDTMRQVHSLQLKAAQMAGELQGAARKLHDADLSRHENPRKGRAGERMWDITSN